MESARERPTKGAHHDHHHRHPRCPRSLGRHRTLHRHPQRLARLRQAQPGPDHLPRLPRGPQRRARGPPGTYPLDRRPARNQPPGSRPPRHVHLPRAWLRGPQHLHPGPGRGSRTLHRRRRPSRQVTADGKIPPDSGPRVRGYSVSHPAKETPHDQSKGGTPKLSRKNSLGISPAVRAAVIARDLSTCQWCGRHVRTESGWYSIQHRRARGMGGSRSQATNQPANLLLVCGTGTTECHGWIEAHPVEALARGFRISSSASPDRIPYEDYTGREWILNNDARKEQKQCIG
ncbi:HNH endonuclease [Arthrobacter phage Marchesin]|nr:HNH endonuclease [Arthrobacter phage Marchesin]